MTLRRASCLVLALLVGSTAARAQTPAPELTRPQRERLRALIAAVDAAAPEPAGDSATWQTHTMRASDGSHYVAVSMTPAIALAADAPVLLYLRLATAPVDATLAVAERSMVREWLQGSRIDPRLLPSKRGFAVGDMPAMGAGTIGGGGGATVGSADLQIMELQRERERQRKADEEKHRRAALESAAAGSAGVLPFEDFDVVVPRSAADGTRAIERALTAGPGTYDLFVAWVDPSQAPAKAAPRVVRRRLQLGAASGSELALSSVILADHIGVRQTPYNAVEQRAHPYVIGATEIVPARDTVLTPDERLSVAFQIVNPTPSSSGMPSIQVNLRIVRLAALRQEPVAVLSPLVYDATTLPPDFDARLGHPLIAAMSAPLATIPRGDYRLLISAEDRLSGTIVSGGTDFTVISTPRSLLAEAPPLGARFEIAAVLQPAIVAAVIDQLSPAAPSAVLARSLQSARAGRFADLLIEEPVPPSEQGVRAALSGLALLSLGNAGAMPQLEHALQSPVAAAPVQFLLGAARAMQNRDAEAIAAWRAARLGGMSAAIVDRFVAEAYLRRREFDNAAGAIAASDDEAASRVFAATRIAIGREPDAVKTLDSLLAVTPGDDQSRWLLLHALYSAFVRGDLAGRERLIAEARRYIEAKGAHAELASEWLKTVTSS